MPSFQPSYLAAAVLLGLSLCGTAARAEPVNITTFDLPPDVQAVIDPESISDEGVIVGDYSDMSGNTASFLREADGTVTAHILEPKDPASYTVLHGVNDEGLMVGFYADAVTTHGFLLEEGRYTTWDFPGAAETALRGVNNRGDLAGTYYLTLDPGDVGLGFIVPRRGHAISFPPPAGTTLLAIEAVNDHRSVVGWYWDSAYVERGLLRGRDGQIRDIVFPGAERTRAIAINDCGVIVGPYVNSNGDAHGFYGRAGALQSFDVPAAVRTRLRGINNRGQLLGAYQDAAGATHGFFTDAIAAAACD